MCESKAMTLYPKVTPDPSMYCPSVLVIPFGPAPNLIILKPPVRSLSVRNSCKSLKRGRTKYEPHDEPDGCGDGEQRSRETGICGTYNHPA